MEKEFLGLYAPHNAKSLTQEQLEAMKTFTKEQVKGLAEAYPNNATKGAYLILMDKTKTEKKQTFPLSTWRNLFELWKIGQTQYVPISFRSVFNLQVQGLKTAPVQDLTKEQAKAELRTATTQAGKNSVAADLPKSPEQVAKEEADNFLDKPVDKMNVMELSARYEELFDEEPEPTMNKKDLLAAIKSKQ